MNASRSAKSQSEQPWLGAWRIAFFGGSFDPPHMGHLAAARAARDAFELDFVLFAPVGAQPLKPDGSSASFEQRAAMTRLAIDGERGFAVSLADAPKHSGGSFAPNYTIDTLKEVRATLQRECALYCLMGADSFFGLHHWHRATEIPFVATLIVASRPGQPLDGLKAAFPAGLTLERAPKQDRSNFNVEVRAFTLAGPAGKRAPFYVLPGLDVEISATEIREQLHHERESGSVGMVLPPRVAEYIRAHGLYR